MDHYTDDVEVRSPVLARLTGDPSGTVRGTAALRDCFQRGLAAVPDLRLEIVDVLRGVDGMTIYYRNQGGDRVVEIWQLDAKLSTTRRTTATLEARRRPGGPGRLADRSISNNRWCRRRGGRPGFAAGLLV